MLNPRSDKVNDLGKEWVARSIRPFKSVQYGNGVYIATGYDVADKDKIYVSTDTRGWEETTFFEDVNDQRIEFVNNLFFIPRYSGTVTSLLASSDGRDWFKINVPATCNMRGVAYGNGMYLAVQNHTGDTNQVSTDGFHWEPTSDATLFIHVVFFNGLFVAVADDYKSISTSPDGEAWTIRWSQVGTETCQRLCVGNNMVIGSGWGDTTHAIMISYDAESWTLLDTPIIGNYIYNINYGEGIFIANGADEGVLRSTDGVSWFPHLYNDPVIGWETTSLYANGQFLSFDKGGQVYVSGDKITVSPPPLQGADREGFSEWSDLLVPSSLFKTKGVDEPSWGNWIVTGGTVAFYVAEFQNDEEVFFTIQLPHTYKEGTDLRAHVHWTPRAKGVAESGNTVAWKLDVSWANIDGDPFPVETTIDMTGTCSGVNDYHEVSEGATYLDGTGKQISSMLLCRVYRDTTDTWTATAEADSPCLLQFDFHHEIDGFGSRTEWVK